MSSTERPIDISLYIKDNFFQDWLETKNLDARFCRDHIVPVHKNGLVVGYNTKQKLMRFSVGNDLEVLQENLPKYVAAFFDSLEEDLKDHAVTSIYFSPALSFDKCNTFSLGLYGFIVKDILELEMVYLATTDDYVVYS